MTPTPQPQEAVIPSETHCQACGSEIQGWICQGCGLPFRESDGRLIVDVAAMSTREAEAPVSEAVAWRIRQLHHEIDGPITGWQYCDRLPPVSDRHRWEIQPLYTHPAPSPASAWKPGREAVARAIDPAAFLFGPDELDTKTYNNARDYAFERADRVLSLPTPPATEGAGDE